MGLGYPRGGPRGGRGRGGFQNSNDFNQAPPQNENLVAPPSEGSEKPQSTAPISTQSGNNVQVVTTGGPPAASQAPPQQQGGGQLQQQSPAPIQSNVSMNNPPPSRGGHRMGGRGFGSRGSFGGRGGRGSFGQSMPPPRQQFDTRQPSNLTQTLPPKRYDQQGSMQPPKRGRYDSGPYMGNRNITPNQPPPMASQHHHHQQGGSYNSMPP